MYIVISKLVIQMVCMLWSPIMRLAVVVGVTCFLLFTTLEDGIEINIPSKITLYLSQLHY